MFVSVSETLSMTHGVPQGALLSQLLFCIYTNDDDDSPKTPSIQFGIICGRLELRQQNRFSWLVCFFWVFFYFFINFVTI